MDFLSTEFNLIQIVIGLLILFISVAFHEYSHGWAAYQLGDDTAERAGRLTLNPISHVDLFGSIILPFILIISSAPILFGWAKPVPYNPLNLRNQRWGPALVAGAGPLSNFILAAFSAILFHIVYSTQDISLLSVQNILIFFVLTIMINIFLAVFNLLPIPPLDGSKIFASIFPQVQNLFNRLEAMGPLLIFVIIIVLFSFVASFLVSITLFFVHNILLIPLDFIYAIFRILAGG